MLWRYFKYLLSMWLTTQRQCEISVVEHFFFVKRNRFLIHLNIFDKIQAKCGAIAIIWNLIFHTYISARIIAATHPIIHMHNYDNTSTYRIIYDLRTANTHTHTRTQMCSAGALILRAHPQAYTHLHRWPRCLMCKAYTTQSRAHCKPAQLRCGAIPRVSW